MAARLRQPGQRQGHDFLATYYYDSGVAVAGGINPGINTAPIPPALKQQAEQRFALAREWYERAAAKNDGYAIGKLAIMLDAGVGGPADPNRAAQLREQLKHPNTLSYTDPTYVKKATADPGNLSMATSWQAGHYAEALQNAQARAVQGDANAEALLGRAYYEGVGVTRNYSTALYWLNKAVAQNNADAMFILGLMYEWGRGVNQNLQTGAFALGPVGSLRPRIRQDRSRWHADGRRSSSPGGQIWSAMPQPRGLYL